MDEMPIELLIIASYHDEIHARTGAIARLCDLLHVPPLFHETCRAIGILSTEKFEFGSEEDRCEFGQAVEEASRLASRLTVNKIENAAAAGNFREVSAVLDDPQMFENARMSAHYGIVSAAENAIKKESNVVGDEELQAELIEISLSPRLTPDIQSRASRRLSVMADLISDMKSEKSSQDLLIIASHHAQPQERMQAVADLCSWFMDSTKAAAACRSIRLLSKANGIQDPAVAKEVQTAKELAILYMKDQIAAARSKGNYIALAAFFEDPDLFSTVRTEAQKALEPAAAVALQTDYSSLGEYHQRNLFAISISKHVPPATMQQAADRLALAAMNIKEIHEKEETAIPDGLMLHFGNSEDTPPLPGTRLVRSENTPKAPPAYERKARRVSRQ